MRFEQIPDPSPGEADAARRELRTIPPGVLYALAASRTQHGDGWRDRGAALLLEAAADEQVMHG
jgi:hypothetical protein